MWLQLETGAAKHIRTLTGIDLDGSGPNRRIRRSLVLEAAHTRLPEAALENLPAIGRAEIATGLTGPLREEIAGTEPRDDTVGPLRDHLIEAFTGQNRYQAAVELADYIHLCRLVNREVPSVVAAGCLGWYGSYRDASNRYYPLVQSLMQLHTQWIRDEENRARISDLMRAHAITAIGEHPVNPIDQPV